MQSRQQVLKYLSPVGSMIKFWVTTFWFMKVAWLWCFKFRRNQKVVTQNFIMQPTGDEYFNWFLGKDQISLQLFGCFDLKWIFENCVWCRFFLISVTFELANQISFYFCSVSLGNRCLCMLYSNNQWKEPLIAAN